MSIKNITRSSNRYANKKARIVVQDDGSTRQTRTTRDVGNQFSVTSVGRKTLFIANTKSGVNLRLNGRDTRTLLRLLKAHYDELVLSESRRNNSR